MLCHIVISPVLGGITITGTGVVVGGVVAASITAAYRIGYRGLVELLYNSFLAIAAYWFQFGILVRGGSIGAGNSALIYQLDRIGKLYGRKVGYVLVDSPSEHSFSIPQG